MKKIILFLAIISVAQMVWADQEKLPILERTRGHRLELVQKQDEMLELLLQIPFEKRQYIFPLLSAKQSVPKKIKTHPEVLVWKGKRPTRIADRFKDDEELIQYLPEQFYYFLAPEMWPPEGKTTLEINPNKILQNMMSQQTDSKELSVMPEELLDIYNGLNTLQKQIQKQSKQPQMPLYFKEWAASLPQEVKNQIQEKTKMNVKDFGEKTDKIAQTYRLYQSQKIPLKSHEEQLVQEYWSLIPLIFQKTGFTDTLNPAFYPD